MLYAIFFWIYIKYSMVSRGTFVLLREIKKDVWIDWDSRSDRAFPCRHF